MTYNQYIKILFELKKANENRIIGVIPEVEEIAYDALLKWVDNSLDTKGGSFFATNETLDLLNNFDSFYLRFFNEIKSYNGAVSKFVLKLPEIGNTIKEYQTKTNLIDWGLANIAPTQKLVVNEILKSYTDNGLNANFVQPLRDLIYQNIISGTSVSEAKKTLKEFVKGNPDISGKLKSYLTNTAQQAVDGYTGAINKKLMDTFDFPVLIMSGSLIATSSPQCRFATNDFDGLIKETEWSQVVEVAKKDGVGKTGKYKTGFIEGTTFKNVPFNKLHHGCRHEFTPSMMKAGDKIGTNEIAK
jgi:hypothetical protein